MPATPLKNFTIGFPLYPGFDSLDVLGPFQVFTFLGVKPILLAATSKPVTSFEGVTITPHKTFADIYVEKDKDTEKETGKNKEKDKVKLNAFFVPGADTDGLQGVLKLGPIGENSYLDFLISQAYAKDFLRISVCTGALLLGAAGILEGYTATTHWAYRTILQSFKGVTLASGYPRYVIDRNLITGGGISSGIDEALAIAGILAGDASAQRVQLSMQYAPNPPYQSGDPSQAGPAVLYNTSNSMGITELAEAFEDFLC